MATCLLVDDQPALRSGLRQQLCAGGLITACAEVGLGPEAVTAIVRDRPDLVVLGLRLPGLSGLETIQQVRDQGSTAKFIVMSTLADRNAVERSLAAGGLGYVQKQSELPTISAAAEAVLAGNRFIDPMLAASLFDKSDFALSARELDVLEAMGNGQSNKEIARHLGLSEDTVKAHVASVLRKLGVQSRTQAVALAIRSSLIE